MIKRKLFSVDNPKAAKAAKYGFLNAIHYMAPADLSGKNLCPWSTPACRALCLGWTAGQAGMVSSPDGINSVRRSRIEKAQEFMAHRNVYLTRLAEQIGKLEDKALRDGLTLVVRLNGSTDIPWEHMEVRGMPSLMAMFPEVQFVDYTKSKDRALKWAMGEIPPNYDLTFSRSESNDPDCEHVLDMGGRVAAVFKGPLPSKWMGYPVVNGDEHDLRHLDGRGVVVGLSPKGAARKDTSGFVIDTYERVSNTDAQRPVPVRKVRRPLGDRATSYRESEGVPCGA